MPLIFDSVKKTEGAANRLLTVTDGSNFIAKIEKRNQTTKDNNAKKRQRAIDAHHEKEQRKTEQAAKKAKTSSKTAPTMAVSQPVVVAPPTACVLDVQPTIQAAAGNESRQAFWLDDLLRVVFQGCQFASPDLAAASLSYGLEFCFVGHVSAGHKVFKQWSALRAFFHASALAGNCMLGCEAAATGSVSDADAATAEAAATAFAKKVDSCRDLTVNNKFFRAPLKIQQLYAQIQGRLWGECSCADDPDSGFCVLHGEAKTLAQVVEFASGTDLSL